MSLHRVDPRYVLSHPVRRALVLGELDDWRAGLASAGIDAANEAHGSIDLVVCPAGLADAARRSGARSIIVEGSVARVFRDSGYASRRVVLRPTRARPTLALPLDQRAATAYALERWSVVDRRWKAARMRAAHTLVSRGLFPPWASPVVTAATQMPGPPYLVAAARDLGVADDAGWFLTFGQGDSLSRNAFQLFQPGAKRPEWVLKFARVSGYSHRFDNDERGLRLARAAGGVVAARTPRLAGRFDVDGVHASLETAASGRRLRDVLLTPGGHAAKLQLIDRIADWILELGRLTQTSNEALAPELARLRRDVVPHWSELGARPSWVDELPELAAVAQHNDLGTWNVVADEGEFTVVDWENSTPAALPLWDLLYFLADALVLLDESDAPEHLPARVARLFAGEAPSSPLLFSWVRRGAERAGVPDDAVGALTTLCWLSHSISMVAHNKDIAAWTPEHSPRIHGLEGIGRAWLEHPSLGPTWSAWRA